MSIFLIFLCFLFHQTKVECKPFTQCNSEECLALDVHSTYKAQKELCDFCFILLPLTRHLIASNETSHFRGIATEICKELKIADSVVCDLAIKTYELSILSVAKESQLKSADLCSMVLKCSPVQSELLNWNITLPSVPKPPVEPLNPPKPDSPKIRILQLSDIHIDFEYQPGSIAECDQPLCCRNSSKFKNDINPIDIDNSLLAGYWGDYRNCDVPLWTVENMFDHISKNEQFDFIYWTGDLPPHNVWNQSRTDQLYALSKLTELFKRYFPKKLIFPTLGNHEAQPCNLFPTPYNKEDNINWLYSSLANEWTQTGLPFTMKQNISNGAFYTIKLFDKLRLISLNTNYCPKENFWLFINSTDPLDQLKWLSETLQISEDNNERVHIIGHIHPSECLDSWSANYYKIVNRYENTIATQIFGHDHTDYFRIFYDLKNLTRPVSISFLGPSVTTKSFLNPGFRIYEVDGNYDGSSWHVIDHHTKILNLTEANLLNNPKYIEEYSAKAAFNLENLFPQDWSNLADSMMREPNSKLVDKLIKFYYKSSNNQKHCDLKCRKSLICNLKRASSEFLTSC